MAKKDKTAHVSETPATQLLRAHKVAFTEHPYDYVEHGGTEESARQLGLDEHVVVKTLVMQDQDAKPLIVLMHGDCKVSTKNLARQIGAKSVEPCKPEVANRHSGYLVGGTSPFGTRKQMPVFIEESILQLPRIARYESVRKQRWGRPESLAAARRYNQLARDNGLTPTQMALAFCYTKWQVASTIIGVTSLAQLDEDLNAWGTTLSPELLKAIDTLRWEMRDPAQ